MTDIIKSQRDHCSYLFETLSNGLKCLLIHDSKSNKSACSMNVSVGSLNDPKKAFGLAHFVEHLLFLGTKKYPIENAFHSFLNSHNGLSNAYTQLDSTNYFFNIEHKQFENCINYFAHFFINPTFTPSAIRREVMAIEHEKEIHKRNDSWRLNQLILSETNKKSLFSCFNIGSLETLNKSTIRNDIITFFTQYYSSNSMNLCMISPLSLNKMEQIANSNFSSVPNKQINKLMYSYPKAFEEDNLGKVYKIIPVKNENKIVFQWHFEGNGYEHYESKPFDLICSVINSQRRDSLTHILKQKQVINDLKADYDIYAQTFTKLTITIDLTQKGIKQYENLICNVINYIDTFKKEMINEEYINEQKQISEAAFHYKNKENELDYCSTLSNRMSLIPRYQDLLIMPYLYREVNPKNTIRFISQMTNSNLNIFITSKQFNKKECNLTERWFGTQYLKSSLSTCLSKQTDNVFNFKLPSNNKYISTDYSLVLHDNELDCPQLIQKDDTSIVYYKQDNTFKLPKCHIIMRTLLNTNKLMSTQPIVFSICNMLWRKVLLNELEEEIYLLNQAGIHLSLTLDERGLLLSIDGFSQNIEIAISNLLKKINQMIYNPSSIISNLRIKFNDTLTRLEKELFNFNYLAPYRQLLSYHSLILSKQSLSPDSILHYVKNNINKDNLYDCFMNHLQSIFSETKFEWLLQGNLTREKAKSIVKVSESIIKTKQLQYENEFYPQLYSIPPNAKISFNIKSTNDKERNNCILAFNETGLTNQIKAISSMKLMNVICKEQFFNELRTKKTLGYIVSLFNKQIRNKNGIVCLIQSSTFDPMRLLKEINAYFNKQFYQLEHMSKNDFSILTHSCINKLQMKDISLSQEVNRNYHEIDNRTFDFNKAKKQIDYLKNTVTKNDILEEYNKLFLNPQHKRQIVINYFTNKINQSALLYKNGFWTFKEIQRQLDSYNKT